MLSTSNKRFLIISSLCHFVLLLIVIISFDFSTPVAVLENTKQHDVISAIVLGDVAKSKILPHEIPPPKLTPPINMTRATAASVAKDVIALKTLQKFKKRQAEKKSRDDLAKEFLADIEKLKKQKKIQEVQKKMLAKKFQKTLQQEAEKSLRQQLLNEEIKLKTTVARYSQGVINKYKALILQSISEHWIVPIQANKRLSCDLMIRLAPGGKVLDVSITKSSGDPALDSSARAAVLKSSPLPVPNATEEFAPFKQFVLKVTPENVVQS